MNLRVAANYVLLTAGECLSKVFTFFAFAYLGRVLGPERYGSIEFIMAVMVFFTLPVDFGLGSYGAREIARERSTAIPLLQEITLLRSAMALCSFCALMIFVMLLPKSAELKLTLVLYGFGLFAAPALLQWFFQGHEQMRWVAAISVVRQGVFATLVGLFVKPGLTLPWIGVFELASVSAAAIAGIFLLRKRLLVRAPQPRVCLKSVLRHFRFAGPIGMAELAWAFLSYFPTVLLGVALADETGVGWFGASHRLVMALHTFVWLYFFNLLPSISRCVPQPKERLLELISGSLRLTVPVALLGGLLLSALSGEVLAVVYGQRFSAAGPILAVLVWVIPIAMISGHYRYALLAYDLQKQLLYITLISAAISVLLSVIMVRPFGAIGTAAALVSGHLVTLILSYRCVRNRVAAVSVPPWTTGQLAAMGLFLACFTLLARTGVWTAALVSALAYISWVTASQLRIWKTG